MGITNEDRIDRKLTTVILLQSSPREIRSSTSSGISVSPAIDNVVNELKFSSTRLKSKGSSHSVMPSKLADWT